MFHLDTLQSPVWVFSMQISQILRGENILLLCYLKLKNYMAKIFLNSNLFYKIPDKMILKL